MISDSPKVEDQPVVIIERWRIYKIDDEDYLVCLIPETGCMRTTSAIKNCDTEKQEITTESGRVYRYTKEMSSDHVAFRMALLLNGYIDDLEVFDQKLL